MIRRAISVEMERTANHKLPPATKLKINRSNWSQSVFQKEKDPSFLMVVSVRENWLV
jgi:hypothetical protein